MNVRGSLLFAALLLTGCAHFPLNEPLPAFRAGGGYRLETVSPTTERDEILLAVSFSGGGTRAAAFSYGLLEALKETSIVSPAGPVRLVDEIDVVAAVSGGSITASYFALFGERLFDDFESLFLVKNVQGALAGRIFRPRNLWRLASGDYERVDLVAEYFDRHLFAGKTFADLPRLRPYLVVSATDISLGVPFHFTQDSFDLLCADLEAFPIARAVAASSAVPVLLTPVTLKNYGWQACGYGGSAVSGTAAASLPRRERARRSYRDSADRPWIHLFDGGLSDNLGLRALLEEVFDPGDPCGGDLEPEGRKVVVIVVNAVTELERRADKKKQGPSLAQTVWAAANIPIDQHTDRTIETLRPALEDWLRRVDECSGRAGAEVEAESRIYPIVVDFEAVRAFDPAQNARLQKVPTTFNLSAEMVRDLRDAAARALENSAEFQRLLADLAADP